MKTQKKPPIYLQVAYDIASKIATGVLAEQERFSGRSLMSSQYGVSPETIRRALRLLSDMGIITIQENVGSQVLSKRRAMEYVEHYEMGRDLLKLKCELNQMMTQRRQIDERISDIIGQITDLSDRFRNSDRLRTYKFVVDEEAEIEGKSIFNIGFRKNTGATIVAVQRGDEIMLSPKPQTVLKNQDVLVIACDVTSVDGVASFISAKKQPKD
ncbi:TrkA C-terminal domain-containing protein [Oscillospiraceae bacterium LTW-04]|nr:TrkA C-terminal domain-containing protein [Oscillospiraceae bacterium MB24-C1]